MIRLATVDDLPMLRRLACLVWPDPVEACEEALESLSHGRTSLVEVRDGNVVACALACRRDGAPFLRCLAVLPAYRKLGIARRLTTRLTAIMGPLTADTWTSRIESRAAMSALGFTETGESNGVVALVAT